MKKAFISGTDNPDILTNIGYKLQFLGYEAVYYNNPDDFEPVTDVKRGRLMLMLDVDLFIIYESTFGGKEEKMYQFEKEMAGYLGLHTIPLSELEKMVSDKVVNELKKVEEEIPEPEEPEKQPGEDEDEDHPEEKEENPDGGSEETTDKE